MKKLIIGKNSKIVREIEADLHDFEILSHGELTHENIKPYDIIYLFSWSHKSLQENIDIINLLDLSKTCFISTSAVFSLLVRPQWANYPNHKATVEKMVLDAGGKVLRIGVWGEEEAKKIGGILPLTTPSILLNALSDIMSSDRSVINAFSVVGFPEIHNHKLLAYCVSKLSDVMPASFFFQAPVSFLAKLLGLKKYSYSRDSLKLFSEETLVGFGVVGSAVSSEMKRNGICHTIIVGRKDNQLLDSNGFINTMIGRSKEGLSNYWHGVSITGTPEGEFLKNVPFYVSRPKAPKDALNASVCDIEFYDSSIFLRIDNPLLSNVGAWSKRVHLAAGVVQNQEIIRKHMTGTLQVSDHELANIGKVDANELVREGFIKKPLFFLRGRKVAVEKTDNDVFLIDFRPHCFKSKRLHTNDLLYSDRKAKIVSSIFKAASFQLINQALFNKFGLCLNTAKYFDVYVQIEARNCITLDEAGAYTRERISQQKYKEIQLKVGKKFSSFDAVECIKSIDGIHLFGSLQKASRAFDDEVSKKKRLVIYGMASENERLGPLHHSKRMIDQSKNIIRQLLRG